MKYFALLFILFYSCEKSENKKQVDVNKRISNHKKIFVDYQVKAFSNVQKENDSIIARLENCINSKEVGS